MARWERIRSRGRVEDRRGRGPAMAVGGLGGAGLVVFLLLVLLGGDPGDLGTLADQLQPAAPAGTATDEFAGRDAYEVFAATVLGSANDTWRGFFAGSGLEYREPTLVLFRGRTDSACGGATSAVGPHYCPLDETIYLDETFFDELQDRFGARGGDVAEAYVIAHEVAHHVQHLTGTMDWIRDRQRANPAAANKLSVALELQADCYAGVWAASLDEGVLEPGEIAEALDAAAAVGDDRIQARVQGQVNPETWTHGSSEQRVDWLERGYATADPNACETFAP